MMIADQSAPQAKEASTSGLDKLFYAIAVVVIAFMVTVAVLVVVLPDSFGELLALEIFLGINLVVIMYSDYGFGPARSWAMVRAAVALFAASVVTAIFYPDTISFALVASSGIVALGLAGLKLRGD